MAALEGATEIKLALDPDLTKMGVHGVWHVRLRQKSYTDAIDPRVRAVGSIHDGSTGTTGSMVDKRRLAVR